MTALATFEPVRAELFPREQARVLRLLVDRIVYDAGGGEVEIRLRPGGIRALAVDDGRKSA